MTSLPHSHRLFQIALGPAIAVSVTTGGDSSLFNNINEYLNVLQSVQLPFAMLPVLHFAASKDVMGRFASSHTLFWISGCLALLVMTVNVILVAEFIQSASADVSKQPCSAHTVATHAQSRRHMLTSSPWPVVSPHPPPGRGSGRR